jgi:hypothetical protein
LNALAEFLTKIDQELLPSIFESWVNWLKLVNKPEGKY